MTQSTPESGPTMPLRLCVRCRSYRPPRPVQPFSPAELHSPGTLAAQTKWDEERRERAVEEMHRAETGLPFDYEPHHFAWCAHYTRLDLVERAARGDQAAWAEAVAADVVVVDPVSGDVSPAYQLCQWWNADGDCDAFVAAR